MRRANNSCVVYNFEDRKEYHGIKPLSNGQVEVIAQALKDADFCFNYEKDTLIICMYFADYLIHKLDYGPYISIPIVINAFSSLGEISLDCEGEHENTYQTIPPNPYNQIDPLIIAMINNDLETFYFLHNQYHAHGLGGAPNIDFRIVINNKKIESASAWIYEINGVSYYEDLQRGVIHVKE